MDQTDLRSFFTFLKYLLGLFPQSESMVSSVLLAKKGSRNRMTVKILFFLKLAAVKIVNVPNLIYEIMKCPNVHSRERSFLASFCHNLTPMEIEKNLNSPAF